MSDVNLPNQGYPDFFARSQFPVEGYEAFEKETTIISNPPFNKTFKTFLSNAILTSFDINLVPTSGVFSLNLYLDKYNGVDDYWFQMSQKDIEDLNINIDDKELFELYYINSNADSFGFRLRRPIVLFPNTVFRMAIGSLNNGSAVHTMTYKELEK